MEDILIIKMDEQTTEMQEKKSSLWIWILVIAVLIAAGIGIYLWISGGDVSSLIPGSSVPQPPALPN